MVVNFSASCTKWQRRQQAALLAPSKYGRRIFGSARGLSTLSTTTRALSQLGVACPPLNHLHAKKRLSSCSLRSAPHDSWEGGQGSPGGGRGGGRRTVARLAPGRDGTSVAGAMPKHVRGAYGGHTPKGAPRITAGPRLKNSAASHWLPRPSFRTPPSDLELPALSSQLQLGARDCEWVLENSRSSYAQVATNVTHG